MPEILTSIALLSSTVGGIAVAGEQVPSFWRGARTLLPRVDPEKYFDTASAEGERLSEAIRKARSHLEATAPFAKQLFNQLLWRTVILSIVTTVVLSVVFLAGLQRVSELAMWGSTGYGVIGLLFGAITSRGVWRLAPPGQLKAIARSESDRAQSAGLDGSLASLQRYAKHAVSTFEQLRVSQGRRLLRSVDGLSVIEFEFLAARVELQSQIRSLETWRYIKGLRTLELQLHEASVGDVFNIITHVIEQLVHKGALKPMPTASDVVALTEWRSTQRTALDDEFRLVGFAGWLEVAGQEFAEQDFATIVKRGELEKMLKMYLPAPGKEKEKPRRGWF
jgi:hypothetical protein